MKAYYVWIGTFEESDFEQYWDNELYENEMEQWKKGERTKPSESLRCGFCREMSLEELDEKDFWFSFRPSLCDVRELGKDYIADLGGFQRKCKDKRILEGVNRHLSKYFEGEMKRKNAICL